MKREDLRKVEFENENDEIVQGYFHQWVVGIRGHSANISPVMCAMVELEDGKVIVLNAKYIKFVS